jgi:hypothetical protein
MIWIFDEMGLLLHNKYGGTGKKGVEKLENLYAKKKITALK